MTPSDVDFRFRAGESNRALYVVLPLRFPGVCFGRCSQ